MGGINVKVVYKIGALTTLNGACFNVKVVVSQYR